MAVGGRARQLDRLARAADRLRRAVLDDGEATTPAVRRAAYDGGADDPLLAGFVGQVRAHADRIGDADIAALRAHGLSEDAIFEVTVSAALGAAQHRLERGLALLDIAPDR